jgi:hypothetical protein
MIEDVIIQSVEAWAIPGLMNRNNLEPLASETRNAPTSNGYVCILGDGKYKSHLRHTKDADNSLVALLFDEFSYDGLEFDRALDRSAFEIDPAFVESVQHPNP